LIAFKENLTALLESVEDCLAKQRILPCLTLLYSGIDVVASLEHTASTRYTFIKWVEEYLLKDATLPCTGADLYGARCGILHSFSAESELSKQGKARQIIYAWGTANAEDLASASKALGRNDCAVHIRDLINALRVGSANYLEEIMLDPNREQKLKARANLWFTHMGQDAVKAFLEIRNSPLSSAQNRGQVNPAACQEVLKPMGVDCTVLVLLVSSYHRFYYSRERGKLPHVDV
jgi:hypothetical protein